MQTKTLASLKHAHIGPALAMLALAVAALGLSACGRVVPKPPKAAKDTQAPATPADETAINLHVSALRGIGDHFCYELNAKVESGTDGKETDTAIKNEELCIFATDKEGLYKITTDRKELVDAGWNGMKVVSIKEEAATPAKKLSLDESLMAASAEAPKKEEKKAEKKIDHKERFAKAIIIETIAEKKTAERILPEQEGDKIKISLEFSGSLTENASKQKMEDGVVIIGGKKHKYSRSKI